MTWEVFGTDHLKGPGMCGAIQDDCFGSQRAGRRVPETNLIECLTCGTRTIPAMDGTVGAHVPLLPPADTPDPVEIVGVRFSINTRGRHNTDHQPEPSTAGTCGMGDETPCPHGTNAGRYCPLCDDSTWTLSGADLRIGWHKLGLADAGCIVYARLWTNQHPVPHWLRAGTMCEDWENGACALPICPQGCWQSCGQAHDTPIFHALALELGWPTWE